MWPQPTDIPALTLPAIPPDMPRLDSAALANLHLFKHAQTTSPAAFRVGNQLAQALFGCGLCTMVI